MRDDLLDAQAAVDWAERQIAILENRFEIDYKKKHPYQVKMETDPGSPGEVLLVVQLLGKPDLTINAEFGAIINSLRSSLDILNASLARRNDVDPEGKTNIQFPTRHDTVERACWLSAEVRATLKTISSYDEVEALHKLDRKRKHHRLIEARPTPGSITLPGYFAERVDVWNHLRDRSIIFRFPSGTPGAKFEPTDANCHVNFQMALHEPSLKLKHAPVVPVMQAFVKKASESLRFSTRRNGDDTAPYDGEWHIHHGLATKDLPSNPEKLLFGDSGYFHLETATTHTPATWPTPPRLPLPPSAASDRCPGPSRSHHAR